MKGMGEEKLYFPLLKSVKHQTHFVTDSRGGGARLMTAGSSKSKAQRAELLRDLGICSCGMF